MATVIRQPIASSIVSFGMAFGQRLAAIHPSTLQRTVVCLLLLTQAGLLAYSATRHSPTHLEPAFLASGINHWQTGRFELYRVNPPLVRMVAALPVLAVGCETDWSQFHDGPGSRAEFPLGEDFIKANGPASIPLFFYARWACIPFNLLGAFFAYRWAKELYGNAAGLVTLTLYVFEPNLLAHGELITPDGACTAFGILAGYTFWRWLKKPTWTRAALAGGALGLAELSKMSWLILFGLWPLLWFIWRWMEPRKIESRQWRGKSQQESDTTLPNHTERLTLNASPSLSQLAGIALLAVYLINLGYAFDGWGTPLKDFQFVSTMLTGHNKAGTLGNRFRGTWLGSLSIPLPKQYVLGFDSQKKDLEHYGQKSYLRGEWKDGGWYYYYLYGLLVKVPCGTWGLFILVVLSRFLHRDRPLPLRDELILLAPAVVLLTLVSSQTEFNLHLRYVFPTLGLSLIFLGQAGSCLARRFSLSSWITSGLIGYSLISGCLVYPHHLAYFNDLVGGPKNGHKHLLESNLDWGQDLLYFKEWFDAHPEARPLHLDFAGVLNPRLMKIDFESVPRGRDDRLSVKAAGRVIGPIAGWHAVSVSKLEGYRNFKLPEDAHGWLREHQPVAHVGYSIWIYYMTWEDINRHRRKLGIASNHSRMPIPETPPD